MVSWKEDLQSFTQSVRTMISFRHRHIVRALGGGRVEGHCWLSMELLEAYPISWLLQQKVAEQSDWRVAECILCDVARALSYLHDKQIFHPNLTPENILFCNRAEVVKLGGLVSAHLPAESRSVADLLYLAPERTDEDEPLGDARADLYSLGAIVYTMLARPAAFCGELSQRTVLENPEGLAASPSVAAAERTHRPGDRGDAPDFQSPRKPLCHRGGTADGPGTRLRGFFHTLCAVPVLTPLAKMKSWCSSGRVPGLAVQRLSRLSRKEGPGASGERRRPHRRGLQGSD